jgi:predicted RNA-binding Zn ribbon-like protein
MHANMPLRRAGRNALPSSLVHGRGVPLTIRSTVAPGAWERWSVRLQEEADAPLCLALANTRQWRHSTSPIEQLNTFDDVLAFARNEGLGDAQVIARLVAHAARHPRTAEQEVVALLRLRESIYRIFAARAAHNDAAQEDAELLGSAFDAALAAVAIGVRHDALAVGPRHGVEGLDCVRFHCALSAVSLLTGAQVARIKECADDRGCGRLFVDLTRNGSRRFCLSRECGNRARQAAFRARHAHRATASPPG